MACSTSCWALWVPCPFLFFSEADRYLGVKVGEGAEMVPRQRIVSVGYAFRAEVADDVPGAGYRTRLRQFSQTLVRS